jgi:hypothetical protein
MKGKYIDQNEKIARIQGFNAGYKSASDVYENILRVNEELDRRMRVVRILNHLAYTVFLFIVFSLLS